MKHLAISAALLAWATHAAAQDPAAQTAAAVRAADTAFAQDALAHGTANAFHDFMDPADGLAFTGQSKPTRGAAAIFAAMGAGKPETTLLHWVAQDAWGSKGGDMGVTMGVWALSRKDHTIPPLVTGRYITVWRKDAQGAWRGLIDIGVPDPRPEPNAAVR